MSYYEEYKLRNTNRSDRYRSCTMLKDKETGESFLSTRDIKEIPESSSDIFHTVQPNEVGRLDLIAYKYYRNPLFWWIIAQANDIHDPIQGAPSGTMLRVPTIETLYGYKGILL